MNIMNLLLNWFPKILAFTLFLPLVSIALHAMSFYPSRTAACQIPPYPVDSIISGIQFFMFGSSFILFLYGLILFLQQSTVKKKKETNIPKDIIFLSTLGMLSTFISLYTFGIYSIFWYGWGYPPCT